MHSKDGTSALYEHSAALVTIIINYHQPLYDSQGTRRAPATNNTTATVRKKVKGRRSAGVKRGMEGINKKKMCMKRRNRRKNEIGMLGKKCGIRFSECFSFRVAGCLFVRMVSSRTYYFLFCSSDFDLKLISVSSYSSFLRVVFSFAFASAIISSRVKFIAVFHSFSPLEKYSNQKWNLYTPEVRRRCAAFILIAILDIRRRDDALCGVVKLELFLRLKLYRNCCYWALHRCDCERCVCLLASFFRLSARSAVCRSIASHRRIVISPIIVQFTFIACV